MKLISDKQKKEFLLEICVFIVLALVSVFLTWPLIARLGSSVYGEAGDNLGAIWLLWWFKNAANFSKSAASCPMIGFPYGATISLVPMEPVQNLSYRVSLLFFNEVVVFNLDILLSFFLSGLTMYFLVKHLTGERKAAFFGGLAYLIAPYHAYHTMTIGGGIACVQWLPLYILMLVKFGRNPSIKRAALLAICALLVFGTSVHYGLFALIFTVFFLAGEFVFKIFTARVKWKPAPESSPFSIPVNRKTLLLSLVVIMIVVALNAPFYLGGLPDDLPRARWVTTTVPTQLRIEEYIGNNSASLSDYFYPNRGSLLTRLIKGPFKDYGNYNYGSSLYLGWTLIALSLFGLIFIFAPLNKKSFAQLSETDGKLRERGEGKFLPVEVSSRADFKAQTFGFVIAAFFALLFSLKPYANVGGVKIPLPSWLFLTFLPWFRWYLRAGMLVQLCVVILASVGFSFLLKNLKSALRNIVFLLLTVLMALELMIVPPFRNYSFASVPEVIKRLKELPDRSGVAFYPLREQGAFITNKVMFFQRYFEKPMLNGAMDGTDAEAIRRAVFNPFDEQTPAYLKRLGIEYVVFLDDEFIELKKSKETLKKVPQGFKLVGEFKGSDSISKSRLFRVTARPAKIIPVCTGYITVPVLFSGGDAYRVIAQSGKIELVNFTSETLKVDLIVPLSNPFPEGTVVLKSGGKQIWRGKVRKGAGIDAFVSGLKVPESGLAIEILVEGELQPLSFNDLRWFGASAASMLIGDVKVQVKG